VTGDVIGIDLSLTAAAVARISWPDRKPPARFELKTVGGAGHKDDSLAIRAARLRATAGSVLRLVYGSVLVEEADLVVIEGPSYASTGGSSHDRSGLWWLVVGNLYARGIDVVEVAPNTLKKYATGKGNASKDAVLSAMVRRFPDLDFDSNDLADALALASMGARHLARPVEAVEPSKLALTAMAAPAWPVR